MNEARLDKARESLRTCQIILHAIRGLGITGSRYDIAVMQLYAALDRAWEAQCMARGSY
jgi:hypothetical protein